jgi:hypothetical protein
VELKAKKKEEITPYARAVNYVVLIYKMLRSVILSLPVVMSGKEQKMQAADGTRAHITMSASDEKMSPYAQCILSFC